MTFNLVLILALIISGLEIFTGIITKSLNKVMKKEKKEYEDSRIYTIIKLTFIIIFLGSTLYFLFKGVYILGNWLGIPMDKSILDVIRSLVK